jgi:NhaA family Na+:H+ antiporter
VLGIRRALAQVENTPAEGVGSRDLDDALEHVRMVRREAVSPADALIRSLHPWVAFGIMPVFALANAGVTIASDSIDSGSWHVIVGVVMGLVVGKPVGILLACALTLRTGVATLPRGIGARHLVILGLVAGVGFTMALFIAQLAFSDARLLGAAKVGILAASAAAAVIGLGLGRLLLPVVPAPGAAQTADEAECSTEL